MKVSPSATTAGVAVYRLAESRDKTSKTYAARKPTTDRGFSPSGSASRRPMIGAMIAIPFSPLRTKRPLVRQVWKPAARVAVGHSLAMRQTLCQENVFPRIM
jgi:hypothetical protein